MSKASSALSKIRVLVVDDSAVIRSLLSQLLSTDPEIEVVATAPDAFIARDKLIALRPDVMTLDIGLPRIDGLSFLSSVMSHFPIRTLVISSFTEERSELALKALEIGAIDVMAKPKVDVSQSLSAMASDLIARVKTVARARLRGAGSASYQSAPVAPARKAVSELPSPPRQLVAIASSTGGTEALKVVLSALPAESPPILIVQHMPPGFTHAYAQQLNRICSLEVREARHGESINPACVYIAPGDFHMEVARRGYGYVVHLHQADPVHGVRPAADYLMASVAKFAGANAIGVVLTGMGRDGVSGLAEMKEAGSYNIAQDEATSVVYGMPKAAVAADAVHTIQPLHKIAKVLISKFKQGR